MKTLAVEFSSGQRSVAIVQPRAQGAPLIVAEVVETGGARTRPLAMVDEALREAKMEREQIESLAIGLGPGSYTGIRTAIALAQGWQLARECIAAEAQAAGMTGVVGVVIDAQRDEFYLASYELDSIGWRELQPLRLASGAEVEAQRKAGAQLIGPDTLPSIPGGRQIFPCAGMLGRLSVGRNAFIPGERLEPIYLRETTFVKAAAPRALSGDR
jgi:tRNA threonylcarbamoyladenosine biosynthesis protein TsaB